MMNARTYEAPTMAMALGEIKRELGPSAVIIGTRRFRKGGVLGLIGGREMWRVEAAPGDAPAGGDGAYVASPDDEPRPAWEAPPTIAVESPVTVEPPATDEPVAGDGPAEARGDLAAEVSEIRRMVGSLLVGKGAGDDAPPGPFSELKRHLLEQDVAEALAVEMIEQLAASTTNHDGACAEMLRARLADLVSRRIRVGRAGPPRRSAGRSRIVSLIGPTGVGKTTTIAKLAANYKLRDHLSVGLVTIDNYRIAAVDQLRTYAEIIEVPLEAVLTPGELLKSIHRMSALDVVLIDTAGRSQNDEMRLNELKRFIEAARCDEVQLVVSAAASPRVAAATIEKFSALGPNGIIVTKLDEAATFGMVLNASAATDAAISYVTTGQDVPDDILPAEADALAESILAGKWNVS
jgi:flagellar biosynthesis protein FlhF